MRKKIMLLILGGTMLSASLFAQQKRSCGAAVIRQHILNNGQDGADLLERRQQMLHARSQVMSNGGQQRPTGIIKVPVVFHVVLDAAKINQMGGAQGIIDRINSQIAVLNEDYGAQNADRSRIPSYFQPYFGNAEIQFGLAHTDPNGNATEGYEIITTTASGFSGINDGYPNAKYASSGGANAWDVTRYLNVWVINPLGGGGLLGLTIPPAFTGFGGYPAAEMGVILNYPTLGRRASSSQLFITGFDQGRTLTHEIGHYFELEHIWGDDNGLCPGQPGGSDDGIADTPPQADASSGTPSLTTPYYDACSGAGTNGIMFMNYLDYVDDISMFMFTAGQSNRMNEQLAQGGESYELGIHPELLSYPAGVTETTKGLPVQLAPNPTTGMLHITFSKALSVSVTILNNVGASVREINSDNQTILTIDLSTLPKGLYFAKIKYDNAVLTKKIILQ